MKSIVYADTSRPYYKTNFLLIPYYRTAVMARQPQCRWIRKVFSYFKQIAQPGRGDKQIGAGVQLNRPASLSRYLDSSSPSTPSIISTVDSNGTASLINSRRLGSFDIGSMSSQSRVSAGSSSDDYQCQRLYHQSNDSSEDILSLYSYIDDDAFLLDVDKCGDSSINTHVDFVDVPTSGASAEPRKSTGATAAPTSIATEGPYTTASTLIASLDSIQEVPSIFDLDVSPAPVIDRSSTAPLPSVDELQPDTNALRKTPNVDNDEDGKSTNVTPTMACTHTHDKQAFRHLQDIKAMPVDLSTWEWKKPLRSSDTLMSEAFELPWQSSQLQATLEDHDSDFQSYLCPS